MTPRRTSVQPVERSPLFPATSKKVTPLGRQIAVYAPLSTMYISSRSASSSARSSRSASLRCVVVSESNSLGLKRSILSMGIRSRRDRSLASSWSPSPERSKGRDEVMSSSLRVAAASSLRPKPAPMTIVWYVLRLPSTEVFGAEGSVSSGRASCSARASSLGTSVCTSEQPVWRAALVARRVLPALPVWLVRKSTLPGSWLRLKRVCAS